MILITGANGQLGTELRHFLTEKEVSFLATDANTLDITDYHQVDTYFSNHTIDFVFHCAAYTAVDLAEEKEKEKNDRVNRLGSEYIAKACGQRDIPLLYISTDYVFDGKSEVPYQVNDTPCPLNEYGKRKLEGEQQVRAYAKKHYIIRTSWVFGKYGKNFVYTMLRLAKEKKELTVVSDQYGRPTWTYSLVQFMWYAKSHRIPFGTYHFANDHVCSWYDFAKEILKETEISILPVTSENYPQKACRPKRAVLDLSKTKATGFPIIPFEEALQAMLQQIKED